nr:hypothetical protein [Tanacetum cinerariifolium]
MHKVKRGKVYNGETAKYGTIGYDEDVHELISVETEFSAIVFDDALTSEVTLLCEPTVTSLNDNEIDFRISFDESDDEDYTEHMAWQTDYCIMKEEMSILRGQKSVPGMNSGEREMERRYYSAFT